MAARASIWSTVTNVCAACHSPAAIATTKWIHASRIVATTRPNARPPPTIWTSLAHVRTAIPVAYANRTSTSVICRHRVATVPHAVTYPARISAFVRKATRVATARSTQTIVPNHHARMVVHVWTVPVTTHACAWTASRARIARSISTNVCRIRARMAPPAISM